MEGVRFFFISSVYQLVLISDFQEHYVNDQITDNNWNTMWFYQKPVSATAQNFTGRKGPKDGPDAAASAWDDLLTQYLHEREGKLQK